MKSLIILILFFFSPLAQGAVLCSRGPDTDVLLPRYDSPADPCLGSAVVQAFQYKCGIPNEVEKNNKSFLANIRITGKEACEKHCRQRASNCIGRFTAPVKCGFSVGPKDSQEVGKHIAECGSHCEGTSFSYCSIYHGGYTSFEKSFFVNKTPNCICVRKTKR